MLGQRDAWALVVPRHRTDSPTRRREDELRRDHAACSEHGTLQCTGLGVGTESMGDIAEDLCDARNLDFTELRQLA